MKKLAEDIIAAALAAPYGTAAVEAFLNDRLRALMVHADSELSAIAFGREPSDRDRNYLVALEFRAIYEGKA